MTRGHDYLLAIACALFVLVAVYVLVQLGISLALIALTAVAACLAACAWAVLDAIRIRRKVDAALRAVAQRGS